MRKEVRKLIKEGEWDSDGCSDMKQKSLTKLNVQEKSEQELLVTLRKNLDYVINMQHEQRSILDGLSGLNGSKPRNH